MVEETTVSELIGPWTAEEWCRMRAGGTSEDGSDDILQCCAVTSNFRDAIFGALRMGAPRYWSPILARAWEEMVGHGFPQSEEAVELFERFRDYWNLGGDVREKR